MQVNQTMNVELCTLRSDIATLSAETKASIACLKYEIKRLDDTVDSKFSSAHTQIERLINHCRWVLGFIVLVCLVATIVISRCIP